MDSPAAHPAGQLPMPLGTFVGRAHELDTLRQVLPRVRLLTLTGAGGVGKTRLALELARSVGDEFRDRAVMVELGARQDAALVPEAVAAALGVEDRAQRPTALALVDALQDRQLLLILDNCEHLVQACAELATTLLRRCSGLRILTTSREPLGVIGETAWRVPPLSLPDDELESVETARRF